MAYTALEPYTGVVPKSGGLSVEEEIAACVALRAWQLDTFVPWLIEQYPDVDTAALMANTFLDLSNYQGEYEGARTYAQGDTVTLDGSVFLSTADGNTEATTAASWVVLVDRSRVFFSGHLDSSLYEDGVFIPFTPTEESHPDAYSAGVWTAPAAGEYVVSYNFAPSHLIAEVSYVIVVLRVNAAVKAYTYDYGTNAYEESGTVSNSLSLSLNVGDELGLELIVASENHGVYGAVTPYTNLYIRKV